MNHVPYASSDGAPPKWVGGDRIGKALENRIVRLPIGGTLNQPRLDQNALRAASTEFIRDAAGDIIRQELDISMALTGTRNVRDIDRRVLEDNR